MSVQFNCIRTDATGKEVKSPPPQEPIWNESFRYYRLSQCSSDLFDAYRNLFLAFEALLNSICPKNSKKRESESAWLQRALSIINNNIPINCLLPQGSNDPVSHIIQSQYKDIRCKLQHAKFPKALLPHAQLTPQKVNQAYEELIRIWRYIAGAYFLVSTNGGIITYDGFYLTMLELFKSGLTIGYTADILSLADLDNSILYQFTSLTYKSAAEPGIVRIVGEESIATGLERYKRPIHQLFLIVTGQHTGKHTGKQYKFGSYCLKPGLTISGVDEWKYIFDFRLINSSQPKSVFST